MPGFETARHHLGSHRNFWWNLDYLDLLIERWRARDVESLLDVGCGRGAWSNTLAPLLPNLKYVVGVDREDKWIGELASSVASGTNIQRHYVVGEAERLTELAVGVLQQKFDLVTCQTLLCHMPDPETVLRSMLAMLKPGGLLVVVEPSNRTLQLVGDSSKPAFDLELELSRLSFYLMIEKGKFLLNEGDNSLGDRLEDVLGIFDLDDRQSYLSDKAVALRPPYRGPGMATWSEQIASWADEEIWIWPKEQAKRYFLAGGGGADNFEDGWSGRIDEMHAMAASARARALYLSGGRIMYIQSGRTQSE